MNICFVQLCHGNTEDNRQMNCISQDCLSIASLSARTIWPLPGCQRLLQTHLLMSNLKKVWLVRGWAGGRFKLELGCATQSTKLLGDVIGYLVTFRGKHSSQLKIHFPNVFRQCYLPVACQKTLHKCLNVHLLQVLLYAKDALQRGSEIICHFVTS